MAWTKVIYEKCRAEIHAGPDGQGNMRIAVESAYEIKDALAAGGYRWDAPAREWYTLYPVADHTDEAKAAIKAIIQIAVAAGATPDARVARALAA